MWGISLQRKSGVTVSRQIYLALRERILSSDLKPGDALPSTRELAKILAVSRNTTCEAYEMLSAEGYLTSRQGAATRVAGDIDFEAGPPTADVPPEKRPVQEYLVDFRTGQPDLEAFPKHAWLQAMHRGAGALPSRYWGYTGPDGLEELRSEIAAWLLRSRGMKVLPDDIFISSGATQALHLLTDVLYREGSPHIIVEDPCHSGMLRVLQNRGFRICPVPVDRQGIQTNLLTRLNPGAIYVTPSHQFPLGGILPAGRRTALVRYARQHQQYIIEDDYDSEFRYSGSPVAPLHTLDPQRVIYVGTFSKILFPSIRIGYVILPGSLQAGWRKLRTFNDVQSPPFQQAA
ncbi:MAG: PLP-dependent aminotransferase family protein, partial [Syntrophomonas sp.]